MDTSAYTHQDGSYSFLPSDFVASHISSPVNGQKCVLVDVRSHREYMEHHIKGAVHLQLNAMQLRRLSKGVSDLETILTEERCKDVLQKYHRGEVGLILYDCSSTEGSVLPDIKTYASILQRGRRGSLFMLNGESRTTACPRARANLHSVPPQRGTRLVTNALLPCPLSL